VLDRHVVEIAENAEIALAMFKASQYDLVITDFKLARMDGLQLAAAIKHDSPATPVFLVTAYLEQFTGNLPNIDLVLGKPFSVAEFQAAVRKALSTV
jgi:CheY-like chemotaxis protein